MMYEQGFSITEIARTINKNKSVVSREIKRNSDEKGRYRFTYAQEMTDMRKERLRKPRKFTGEIENRIIRYIRGKQWSPEQIVGYCRLKGYAMVSIERIYQYIRKDKKNGGDLWKFCRHQLKHRAKPVGGSPPIKDRISIDLRPPEADGTRFGDWEMDLIIGAGKKDAMLTLVERSVNYSIITKLPNGKNADDVLKAAIRELMPYIGTIKSITTDNGCEFAKHKELAKALKTTVFFAHPYASWEKGAIENTNKLYRQYIPKGASFADYTEQEIKQIQYLLNDRPRKKKSIINHQNKFFSELCKKSVAFRS